MKKHLLVKSEHRYHKLVPWTRPWPASDSESYYSAPLYGAGLSRAAWQAAAAPAQITIVTSTSPSPPPPPPPPLRTALDHSGPLRTTPDPTTAGAGPEARGTLSLSLCHTALPADRLLHCCRLCRAMCIRCIVPTAARWVVSCMVYLQRCHAIAGCGTVRCTTEVNSRSFRCSW